MDFVSTLINSGLDAFTNLYDISFTLPQSLTARLSGKVDIGESQIVDLLKIRVGDFNPPQPKIAQYTTDYKTVQIIRLAPMLEFDRKFDLVFRVDSNYYAYHVLKAWSLLYHDMLQGGINLPAGTEKDLLGKIVVDAYAPNTGVVVAKWVYDNVVCNKTTEPSYARAGTEAVVTTASFMFFDYLPTEGAEDTQISGDLVI